ncbi:unnamed protein product [Fraxinus pennsylvanica]|uniref:DUF4378 domain-containing protein n=1 Tax=Fraxinus pennsylvanica TaxID=56036 RepID=A0AAD1ZNG8_9LAMI|nr:unnamed protein product [Fraxinus pennsylvanica]
MGTKPQVESVITRLMCLDEQQPLHPIHKQQSVLSENYLRKTASIGLREGSSFFIGNSRRVCSGWLKGIKDTSELQISKDQHVTQSVNDRSANLSTKKLQTEVFKLLAGPRGKNGEIFSKKSKWRAPENVFKSVQKVENDSLTGHCGELGLDHLNDFLKSQLEILDRSYHSSTRISELKSNSTINKTDFRHRRSYLHPRPGYRDCGESLKAETEKLHNGVIYEEQVSNDMESPIHSFSARKGTMNTSLQPSEFEVMSGTISNALHLRQDDAEMIAQKDSLGSRGSRGYEKIQTSLGVDLCYDCTISRSAMTSELSSCNFSCLGLNNNNPEAYSKGIQDAIENSSEKENRCGDIEHVPRVSKLSDGHIASRSTVETRLANTGISSRIIKDRNSEQNPGIFSVIDAHYYDVCEAFTQQELSNEFSEEELHETVKGINQYSPDSVLSPLEIENSSTSECFESVATDFDSLFESEETHSRGSEMVISNEDMKKEFDDLSLDGGILQWSFGYEESRDFSYLLDVLDKADFDHVDLIEFSKTFNSQEYPVRPLMFEALEKKYSRQTLWRKSERKLLFDRINSGLKEIITIPLNDFDKYTTPLRRTFSTTLNRDEVEEELWQYLISQEKELSNEFSEEELHETLKGINQYSPDSVLSPLEIENSSTSECFESVATDFDGLFESEETHSSGSEMVISNEDMKKESDDLSLDGGILQWSFGYEESRDFSYLLDVLDEADFDHVDLIEFSKTFNSEEYPVRPLMFEALEKKYSKQTLWRKSERKLLFDRINSGLKEIITIPLNDFDKYTTPLRRTFSTRLNRDEVEEELWQYLISQEKVKNKDLSERVLGKEMKWFELEENVNIIVRELESFLFDELAIELVCRDDV